MPKYEYRCTKCDRVDTQYRDTQDRNRLDPCGEQVPIALKICTGSMKRQLTAPLEPIVLETADKYRNVKHRKNQDKRIRDRAKKFFVDNELDEMIEKVGEKKAKQLGWITKDGRKNKGK